MFGELNQEQIEELIRHQVIMRIGCHADGLTYVFPMSYAYDGKYIYGRALEGLKTQMMRKSPAVCVEVENMQDMANWKSVIAWGNYEELKTSKERNEALLKLHQRILPLVSSEMTVLSKEWPFSPEDPNAIRGLVFRICLEKKTGRFEMNNATSNPSW